MLTVQSDTGATLQSSLTDDVADSVNLCEMRALPALRGVFQFLTYSQCSANTGYLYIYKSQETGVTE